MLDKLRKMIASIFNSSKPIAQAKESAPQAKPNSKFGRTVYSSKPLKQLEKESGEKLYKIANGVYVNQNTYDFIHSEEIPVIEDEAIDVFTKIEIEDGDGDVLAAVWSETDTTLIILSNTASPKEFTYSVLKFSGENYTREKYSWIYFDKVIEDFQGLAIDPVQKYLLLTFKYCLVIWNFEADMLVKMLHVGASGVIDSGFYPNNFQVWSIVLNEGRTSCEWLLWDYVSDTDELYVLEHNGEYGRGASLHPSGLLIGALWNAHDCGYYIHSLVSDNSEIRYYREPAAKRPEYENYSPSFSPDGQYFMFVANPYLAMRKNYCKICVYHLETAELVKEFYTGFNGVENQAQFVDAGKRIAFSERGGKNAYVFNPETGKRLAVLKAANTIRYFSGHRIAGYYALAHKKGVTVYYNNTLGAGNPYEFQASAIAIAEKFIKANEQYLAIPEDWES